MKKFFLLSLATALLVVLPAHAKYHKSLAITKQPPKYEPKPKAPPPEERMIEDFTKYRVGKFPRCWRTWPFQRGDAHKVYQVVMENKKPFLHAHDNQDISSQIMLPFVWHVDLMPYLNWRMRPRVLPKGAAENKDNTNDSACGVYVVFGRYTGVASKYAWSTTLPVGTVVSRRDGKLRIKVIGTGSEGIGKWQGYSVNVPQDFKELFGKDMGHKPTGIAVLTDGNATHTPAACDYADFVISKKPLY